VTGAKLNGDQREDEAMRNPYRYVFGASLAACLMVAGCSTTTVIVYVTPAPSLDSHPSLCCRPAGSVTLLTSSDIPTLTLTDCAIQNRYNDVTVILRRTTADECVAAARVLAFMGTWYSIDPDTATQHKNLICKANYVSPYVVGTPTEVWDTGGATLGTEICREWNLFR